MEKPQTLVWVGVCNQTTQGHSFIQLDLSAVRIFLNALNFILHNMPSAYAVNQPVSPSEHNKYWVGRNHTAEKRTA